MTKTLRVIQFEALIPNEGGTTLALFKAYQWESGWRIMATLPKQKIYYELKDLAEIDEAVAVKYFVANRLELDHAKCIRCSKWHVVTGMFCERCRNVIQQEIGDDKSIWYEITSDGSKRKSGI